MSSPLRDDTSARKSAIARTATVSLLSVLMKDLLASHHALTQATTASRHVVCNRTII
jgi:hypothetical protein